MGRKRRFSKLLLFAAMVSTIGAGVLGSVPLPVKAAEEEETYTVRFEAYEGTCETESVTVPKGESIILPDATYEGHYLMNWIDAVKSENMTTFLSVGSAGWEYTPERDLWLYANWKPNPEPDVTVTYEARIGDTSYEELEEAFANAQAGDTITVLKDCEVSGTLEVTADNITLKSEDAGNPVTISREDGFAGKSYGMNTDTVLLAVKGGSLATQDIIFDGGAVLDGDFNNSGKTWNSPLIYVDGSYTMEIITYPQYIRAVSSLKQQKASESKRKKNIYYCGCCGRALFNAHYGTVFCKQRSFKTDSDCKDIEICKHDADTAVLAAIKKEAELYLDRDKLSRQAVKWNESLSVSDRISAIVKSMEAAQKGWFALYDRYADGKLEREFFLNEKKKYDADMERMEEELAALKQTQEAEESIQGGTKRKAEQAVAFLEEDELTEDMKEKLIEKVVVYPGNRIEILWRFREHLEN